MRSPQIKDERPAERRRKRGAHPDDLNTLDDGFYARPLKAEEVDLAAEMLNGELALTEIVAPDVGALINREVGRKHNRADERVSHEDVLPEGPEALTGVLTAREIEIAQLVGAAKRNKEIARALCLSRQTVEGHLRNIYAKLDINSRVELALLVRDLGYRLAAGRR